MKTHGVVFFLSLALMILAASCATSQPAAENSPGNDVEEPAESSELTTIEGVPTMYGNAPHTYVVIVVRDEGEESTYYVHPDYQSEIDQLTGSRYRFSGTLLPNEGFFDARFHDGVIVPETWEQTTLSR